LRLWITSYEPSAAASNDYFVSFRDFEYSDRILFDGKRSFEGKVRIVAAGVNMERNIALNIEHSPRYGFYVMLRDLEGRVLPPAPFLVTSSFTTEILFNGIVIVDPPLGYDGESGDLEYVPVAGTGWFGILSIVPSELPRLSLVAFAEKAGASIDPLEVVRQADVDEPLGRIIPVSNDSYEKPG
jgi:hypothetical protein